MIIHQTTNSQVTAYNTCFYNNIFWAPHFHRSFELIYVIDGKVNCTVNGKTEVLQENELALILPNEIHSYASVGNSYSCVVVFAASFVPSISKAIADKHADKIAFRCSDNVLTYIKAELITKNPPEIFKLKSCLYSVFSEFLSQITLEKRTDEKGDILINKITDYIAENYTEKITLKDLANNLSYNYSYLSRNFKRIFGIGFNDFVNLYRIENAIKLLSEGNMKIAAIALESGFQSVRSFNDIFKEKLGVTPKEYKSCNR